MSSTPKIIFNLIKELTGFFNYLSSVAIFSSTISKEISVLINKIKTEKSNFEELTRNIFNKEKVIKKLKECNSTIPETFNIEDNWDQFAVYQLYEYLNNIHIIEYVTQFVKNIEIFETQIVTEYDTFRKHTTLNELLSLKADKSEKRKKLIENITIYQRMPIQVLSQITILPQINLSFQDIFSKLEAKEIFQLYNKIKNIYAYSTICLRIIKKNKPNSNKKVLDTEQQQEIFDEVRDHVKQYNSNGLNTALDEVIGALNNNKDCNINNIVAEGTNNVTSGKVMNMAKNVAGKLTSKIESGEVQVDELVDSSKTFINSIINSQMFKSHPDHQQVEEMFSSLLDTVTYLSEAHKEDEASKGVDKILEKYV